MKIKSSFRRVLFFLAIALLLFVIHPGVLTTPPYWDTVLGTYSEGLWLARNDFSYGELVHAPHYREGGPRTYLLSVYPGLVATLVAFFDSNPRVFGALHLLSIFCAAGCAFLLFRQLARSYSAAWALAGSGLLLSFPLFLGQSYAIGMEMVVTFLSFLALNQYVRDKRALSALLIGLAFLVKANAAVVALALAFHAVLFPSKARGGRFLAAFFFITPAFMYLIPTLGPLLFGAETARAFVPHARLLDLGLLLDPARFFESYLLHQRIFPDGWVLLVVSVITGVGLLLSGSEKTFNLAKWRETLPDKDRVLLLHLIVVLGLALAFITVTHWLPRYLLIATPSMAYILVSGFQRFKYVGIISLSALLVFNIANHKGALYRFMDGPLMDQFRGGHLSERSLAWLDDQQLYFDLITVLQNDHADELIVAPAPLNQMLHEPDFGYVDQPMNIVSFGYPRMAWNGLANYQEYSEEDLAGEGVLWIDTRTIFSLHRPRMQDHQQIVALIPPVNPRFILFRRFMSPPEGTAIDTRTEGD